MDITLSNPSGVRILCVEDDPLDAKLAEEALRAEIPNLKTSRVDTRDAFMAEIMDSQFDLILSDFTIPGFSGLEALDLARQYCPKIPFVFFSGTIGEERAVEALKHGATDYVIKDRPGRLPIAVRKALDESRLGPPLQRTDDFCILAYSVSHHINNSLTGIYLGLPLLREKVLDPEALEVLTVMETCSKDCASFVRRLELMAVETGLTRANELKRLADASARPFSQLSPFKPAGQKASQDSAALPADAGNGPVVLVVEDDDAIRILVKALLEIGGYRVVMASDGADGLEAYRRMSKYIKAVVTDVSMPVMNGSQLVKELRQLDPEIGVVVMSGLDQTADLIEEPGRLLFVPKPMTKAKLLAAVGQVLIGSLKRNFQKAGLFSA